MTESFDIGVAGFDRIEFLGRGGSAQVFSARQLGLDRQVAIKVIAVTGDDGVLRRFRREQRAMGKLTSTRGVVQVFDTGTTSQGNPYLVMEYIDGGSLADWIGDKGALPWGEACALMAKVARTVEQAHGVGVLHRDLKPANILLRSIDDPVVADFGIAQLGGSATGAYSTSINLTPAFSPPEAFETGEGTVAVDVYGLGATLWSLLAGATPFFGDGDPPSIGVLLRRVATEPAGDLRGSVPDQVCVAVERAMAKEPSDRFESAGELADALQKCVGVSPAANRPAQGGHTLPGDVANTVDGTKPPTETKARQERERASVDTELEGIDAVDAQGPTLAITSHPEEVHNLRDLEVEPRGRRRAVLAGALMVPLLAIGGAVALNLPPTLEKQGVDIVPVEILGETETAPTTSVEFQVTIPPTSEPSDPTSTTGPLEVAPDPTPPAQEPAPTPPPPAVTTAPPVATTAARPIPATTAPPPPPETTAAPLPPPPPSPPSTFFGS